MTNDPNFSHLDAAGNARMVGVGHKPELARRAVARGRIRMAAATIRQLRERALPKGDVLTVAQIAGIQAAKRTGEWIPLCHPLPLHRVDVSFEVQDDGVVITGVAETIARTGVEMEALTAVSAAALTLYDMAKAVDKHMVIGEIELVEKTKAEPPTTAAPRSDNWSPPPVPEASLPSEPGWSPPPLPAEAARPDEDEPPPPPRAAALR